MLIRNPFVWLHRIRHRCGYGIHSPFAFALVTQVLYNPGEYYAYRKLSMLHPWYVRWFRLRPLAVHRLLFRLANYWQPAVVGAPVEYHPYLHEGCRKARLLEDQGRFINLQSKQGRMVVLVDLQHNKKLWHNLKADPEVSVTFDLYDLGLALYLPRLRKQDYIINW